MRRIPLVVSLCLLLAVLLASPPPSHAAWPSDPLVNLPICTLSGSQYQTVACSDERGGAILAWSDSRSGSARLYAQRVSSTGVVLWTADGVALGTGTGTQSYPCICGDGASGAIIAWMDDRNVTGPDVYVQRVNASGVLQWNAAGVALCTAASDQALLHICPDGASGAIVAWHDRRTDITGDIYARRVNASGTPQWTANGVAICTYAASANEPYLVPDDAGGALIVWGDGRNSGDVYGQRVNASGVVQWAANGVPLCTYLSGQSSPAICSDDAGGVIVAMIDNRTAGGTVVAQRVDADGGLMWTSLGRVVCDATDIRSHPVIAPDGSGGAVIAWDDYRNGADYNIYAQRIGADGVIAWTDNGVSLCSATGFQWFPEIVSDGDGGAIVTWEDQRGGDPHIYARRVSASGSAQWASNGVLVGGNGIANGVVPVPTASNGAILAWASERPATSYDVFAQRIDRFGALGEAEPTIVSVKDVARDQGGQVVVEWTASYLDAEPTFAIDAYSVWRKVPTAIAAARALPSGAEAWLGGRPALRVVPDGAQSTYWEYVGSTPARARTGYGFVAATTTDSTATANPTTSFMVSAEVTSTGYYWDSASMAGYSVDNLAPTTPAPFAGTYAGGTSVLTWGASMAPDLAGYQLHRGATADFTPGRPSLVASTTSTAYVDVAGEPRWYKVCAIDVHGNVSAYATTLPNGALAVDGVSLPRELALSAPAPNPLRGASTLRLSLPRAAGVSVAVYDQQGRRVRTLASGPREAGEHALVWDGRDDGARAVASGVYFVHADVDGRRLERRVVVLH